MSNLITKIYRLFGPISLAIFSMLIYVFKYRKFKAIQSVKKGFEDHRSRTLTDDARYATIFKRLLDSYNKAKAEQENISQPYRVGLMWQDILNTRFKQISAACRNRDTAKLQAILENFHREECSYDTGGGYLYYHKMRKVPFYKYQFVNAWYEHYNIYKEVMGSEPQLTNPLVGNPVGLYHKGQTIPINNIQCHYYATEILSLLRDTSSPVICEIGGGVGGQAYTILRNGGSGLTYILLDIPEVLVLASYSLMMSFPEKRFLLYGEEPLVSDKLHQCDVILMPNFMLPQLGDETVDLFFNACSFSEMDSVTTKEYIRQIERICRKYLLHINHNVRLVWYENGKKSVNMIGSEVSPNQAWFKKIYQRPRLFPLLEDKVVLWYYKASHFAFLYERILPATQEALKEDESLN